MNQNSSNEITPEAYGDCLAVVAKAPKSMLPISIIEMHLFSYLACILALFNGNPIANWGYRFSLTKQGFPFSPQFEEARQKIVEIGLLSVHSDATISPENPEFLKEIELLNSLPSFAERCKWIKTATECTLALPLGSIRYALESIPSVRAAIQLEQNQTLLQDHEENQLYEEYEFVLEALEDGVNDPLSPAVAWLSAKLIESRQENSFAN